MVITIPAITTTTVITIPAITTTIALTIPAIAWLTKYSYLGRSFHIVNASILHSFTYTFTYSYYTTALVVAIPGLV